MTETHPNDRFGVLNSCEIIFVIRSPMKNSSRKTIPIQLTVELLFKQNKRKVKKIPQALGILPKMDIIHSGILIIYYEISY